MSHEPILSTDLFQDINGHLKPLRAQTEPFNLLGFLFLRQEFQTVVDIYGACNGWSPAKQPVRPKISRLRDRDEERLEKLIQLYMDTSSFDEKDDYWAAYSLYAIGQEERSLKLFEQSLKKGCKGAAAPLAAFYHQAHQIHDVERLLEILKPFDRLNQWDRALAHREISKFYDYMGEFEKAKNNLETSWNIIKNITEGKILVSLIGQLLARLYEFLGQSNESLQIIHETKPFIRPNRRVQLLYYQILSATHCKHFDEAREALTDISTPDNYDPQFTPLIQYSRGVFLYYSDNIKEAMHHFKNAIDIQGGLKSDVAFAAYLYLFKCAIRLQDVYDAEKYLDQAEHEYMEMDTSGYLPPAHLKRAEAALHLHRGILAVTFRRESAPDHIGASLEIFGELGLSRERSHGWLLLSAWYWLKKDKDRAMRFLEWAHEHKTEDVASFEMMLEFVPWMKKPYETLCFDGWSKLDDEQRAAKEREYFPPEIQTQEDDPAASCLEKLFAKGKHELVLEASRAIFVPKPKSRMWMGLSAVSLGLHHLSAEHWKITPEMRCRRSEFSIISNTEDQEHHAFLEHLEYLATHFLASREQAKNALLHLHPSERPRLNQLSPNFERELLHFRDPKTYVLFAAFIERFKANEALPLENVLHGLWPHLPADQAREQFNAAISEINAVGEKLHSSEFVVTAKDNGYKLERIKISKPHEAERLSVNYLPSEIREHLGKSDALSIWCLQQYKTLFPDMDEPLVNRGRIELEEVLRKEMFSVSKRYIDNKQIQTVMAYAADLVKLDPEHEDWQTELGQTIKKLAGILETTPHHAPGELRHQALGRFESEEDFRSAQQFCFQHNWLLVCDELSDARARLMVDDQTPLDQAQGLEVSDFLGKNKSLKVELIFTGFVMHHERKAVLAAFQKQLEHYGISGLELKV